ASALLPIAIVIALIGFPLFWLAPSIPATLLGLFIAGLGVANLFPLTISVAIESAADHSSTASARVSVATGGAILLTPQILGAIADQVGIQKAFAVTGALLVSATIVVFIAHFIIAPKSNPAIKQVPS